MDEILIFFTLSFLRNGHKAMKKQWLLQGQGGRLLNDTGGWKAAPHAAQWKSVSSTETLAEAKVQVEEKLIVM